MVSPLLAKARLSGREIVNVTPERAGWTHVGFRAIRLAEGETESLDTGARELCIVVLSGKVVLLGVHGPTMLAVIGEGTVLAILVVIVFGLLLGQLLGGPDRGIRDALSSATVSRHPAIALLLATGAFPQQQTTVIGTVLIYLLASILLPIFLMRWRR
jgi:hypothetical protein